MESPQVIEKLRTARQAVQNARLHDAERAYREALALSPQCCDALHFLGLVRHQLGDTDEALDLVRRSVAIHPDSSAYRSNLGEILRAAGRIDEAADQFEAALRIDPSGNAQAYHNLGLMRQAQGRVEEAVSHFEHALAIRPQYSRARWSLALALLLLGDYPRGFREYEWRFSEPALACAWRDDLARPAWDGSDPAGRTILLHAEQGFGDTIQFARYAALLANHTPVVLECQPELKRLLARNDDIDAVVARSVEPLPRYDLHLPLLSAPRVLQTALATIPWPGPYVQPDTAAVERWRLRIASLAKEGEIRVGLSWAGRPTHWNDRQRSIPLPTLAPLLELPNIRFFSLQKGEAARQVALLPNERSIIDLTSDLRDFDDTAALLANLDLVIAVDTAIVHLAGAMGKAAWVLLTFIPDWRWHLGRDDSPWYPSLRLFRQPTAGDWGSVVTRIADELLNSTSRGSPDPGR